MNLPRRRPGGSFVGMSELERAAAKMFCVGFDGTSVTPSVRRLIDRGVSGVVLFGRNVQSPQQTAELTAELKLIAGRPLMIAVDQEGGRVIRLKNGFTNVPAMRAVGQAGDENLAREVGRVLGRELRAVNFDVDFAPVLDVDTNPDNPVIAHRSLSRDPDVVSRLGCAIIQGMQSEGVAACGKHFPGHGDTSQDSHLHLPRLPHAMDRLNRVELPPFEAAVRAGVAMIMTAHVVFEPLDENYPATMSKPVLDGLLRKRLGFEGVIVSDALEMKAIAAHFPVEQVVTRGVDAGIDVFAACEESDLRDRAIDALIHAVERGEVSRDRLAESARRIDTLMAKYVKPPVDASARKVLGSAEHRAVMEEILALAPDASAGAADPTAHRLV
jgi:beta-N-acetylhexosaminidase